MIIHNLDFIRIAFLPDKADSPLIVDANAVSPLTVAMKSLQAVAGRRGQIAQFGGGIQLPQFPLSDPLEGPKPLDVFPSVELLGFLRAKRTDHSLSV